MDDPEKLTALKKAYAEIILNTAKEAAARIMVSEKKALRFQQELFSTKEEGVRMLLRLKQMLDSKVNEAEMMTLSQQRKIEELEAQLQEAEDIVRDLREELREVQVEFEKVTNSQPRTLDEQNLEDDTATQEELSLENRLMTTATTCSLPDSQPEPLTTSDMKNLTLNGTYESKKCPSANDSHMDNCDVRNPYFASIVMRSKEPELYRNGCTQRIRAFERYLLDGKSTFSGQVDDIPNETFTQGDEEGKGMCKTLIHKADNMLGVGEKSLNLVEVMQADSCHMQAVKSFLRKRKKRGGRYTKSKGPLYEEDNGMYVIPIHEADNMLGVEEKNLDELKVMQADSSDIRVQVVKSFRGKRKRAARHKKSKALSCMSLPYQFMETHQPSDLSTSKTSPHSVDNNDPAGENSSKITQNEGQMDPVSTVVSIPDATGIVTQLGSVDVARNDADFVKACSVQKTRDNDTVFINKSDMTRQESLSAENLVVQGCRTDVETVNGSLVDLDLKASDSNNAGSNQLVNNRFLKYTFCRKRKKESLSSPDADSSVDNDILKRKTGEKQDDSLEPQNSSLITESSRDSRRLAQVARQLISLSEKKWR